MTAAPVAPPSGLPVAGGRQTLRAVVRLSRGRRRTLVGVVVVLLVAAASSLVLPFTIGWMVDTVSADRTGGIPSTLWWQVAAVVGAALLGGAAELAGTVALGRVAETMTAELREEFLATVLRLPPQVVEDAGSGDAVTRAATDTRTVSEEVPAILPTVVAAAGTLLLVLIGTAAIDWRFTAAFVLAAPLYARALRWYLPAVPPVYARLRSADSVRGQQVLTTLGSLPTVAAYRVGDRRARAVSAATWEVARWQMRARIMQNRFFGRLNLAQAVGLLLVLGCGFWLAAADGLSLGRVTAAALLFLQVAGPLEALLFVLDDLQSAAASLSRVVGVVDLPDAVDDRDRAGRSTGPVIEVCDVTFAYRPGQPVLRGVDLVVGAGEHVALVGATGSGKTTLARLVAGQRLPTTGQVRRSVPATEVVYLDQEAHVFAGTVRDNLQLAAPGARDEVLLAALATVGADGLVAQLPDGLSELLGAEGHRLPDDQAQLLSLARLVLCDPAVAVLDEATAEADSAGADLLDRAAEAALAGRSAVVIAHRLAQAASCDRIVVLDHGRVAEEGTHEDLLAAGGRYAQLWRAHRPS